jgi:hypothetical protein
MIARLTVVDGTLTEYPLAEKVRGGWQNGVTFYPDEKVTASVPLRVSSDITHVPTGDLRRILTRAHGSGDPS